MVSLAADAVKFTAVFAFFFCNILAVVNRLRRLFLLFKPSSIFSKFIVEYLNAGTFAFISILLSTLLKLPLIVEVPCISKGSSSKSVRLLILAMLKSMLILLLFATTVLFVLLSDGIYSCKILFAKAGSLL